MKSISTSIVEDKYFLYKLFTFLGKIDGVAGAKEAVQTGTYCAA